MAKIKIRPTRAPIEESRASGSGDPFPEPEVEESGAKVIIRQSDSTLGLHLHERNMLRLFHLFQLKLNLSLL